MLTFPNGSRIDATVKYPHKGIVRGSLNAAPQCIFKPEWRMYECRALNYKMFVIESMDPDTETRRISPVGLGSSGYIDLINGPMDHGWCHGYTCQERLSLFHTVVATRKHYEIHFSSFIPQKLRLRFLNAENDDAITMEIFYPKPERLDVYRRGIQNNYHNSVRLCF